MPGATVAAMAGRAGTGDAVGLARAFSGRPWPRNRDHPPVTVPTMKFCAVFFGVPVLAFVGLWALSGMGMGDDGLVALLMLMGVFWLIGSLVGPPTKSTRRIDDIN